MTPTTPTPRPLAKPEVWRPIFLKELERTFNVTKAAKKAGINRVTAYQVRAENSEFAAAWDAAIESCLDSVEEAGIRRAKVQSDALIKFFLSSRRPELYRERLALAGADGKGPIEFEHHVTPASIASFRATLDALGLAAPVADAGQVLPEQSD
jgi:hypothetical protein